MNINMTRPLGETFPDPDYVGSDNSIWKSPPFVQKSVNKGPVSTALSLGFNWGSTKQESNRTWI